MDRRSFVKGVAGASALAMNARAYARILGANDRIRIGQLGCGARSQGHVHMVELASKTVPVETVAVCDLWSIARDGAEHPGLAFQIVPGNSEYLRQFAVKERFTAV